MAFLKRLIRALPLLLLSPFFLAISFAGPAADRPLHAKLRDQRVARGRGRPPPTPQSATVVIPNWNGKDLLAKYIPSIRTALAGNPANEILVVDNGSTDGSVDFLRATFPDVTVLALPQNLGFGGGSNAGFRAARNDIVVLLNSDMRVAAGFSGAAARGLRRSRSLRRLLPDLLHRPGQAPRRDRPHAGMVAGWQPARPSPHRRRDRRPVSLLLWRRRMLRLRPREVPRTRRIRPSAGALLPGRHRPRLHGLEARLEGALPAAQRGISRAPRHHRQEVHPGADPGRPEEELRSVLLEEYSRMAAPGVALLLRVGRRGSGRDVRRRPAAPEPRRALAGLPAASASRALAPPRAGARRGQRHAKPSNARSAATSAIASPPWSRLPNVCACCSSRPIRSARPYTAAASSCTRRCARW